MEKKRRVFYSFHYANDCWRVQEIKNMGVVDGDAPVSSNEWEEVKRKGDTSIKNWIDNAMKGCSCLVVLIGSETANRDWVKYEIKKAWNDGMGVVGVYIDGLKDQNQKTCSRGSNPFNCFWVNNGYNNRLLSTIVDCHTPDYWAVYNDIKNKLPIWVEAAIEKRKRHTEKIL